MIECKIYQVKLNNILKEFKLNIIGYIMRIKVKTSIIYIGLFLNSHS